jgi:putative peptidoglycan lipid II flippase
MMLRGFYAMENTRTPFFIQLAVALTNIVVAVALASRVDCAHVSIALAAAFGASYVVGATLSATVLGRMTGNLFGPDTRRFLLRLAVACAGATLAMLAVVALVRASGAPTDTPMRALGLVALAGPVGAATYLLMTRFLGMTELTTVVSALRRRE